MWKSCKEKIEQFIEEECASFRYKKLYNTEEEYAKFLKSENALIKLLSFVSAICVLICIFGFVSLISLNCKERRKEIAIRKINGARTKDLIRLLLKKYFILLGIAFVLSIPIALFAIHKYLENFAHKTSVSWWLFGIAIVAATGISLLTLIFQTCKASWKNPAEVVKKE